MMTGTVRGPYWFSKRVDHRRRIYTD